MSKEGIIMYGFSPGREYAWATLNEYMHSENLLRHSLAVEAVMRHFASVYNDDAEKWGVVGLLHDIDYEMYPEQHCTMTEKILHEEGWPGEYIRAVISHGYGICSDTEPQTLLEKTLFAIDELTGLVNTSALVRPSRSILDMEARSVRKKWTDKRFAAGVDRSVIEKGAAMLGTDLNDLITDTIMGMRDVAEEIGLKGTLPPG
jgi:putative nucleotidyltransferase with HDIG domain